MRLNQFIAHATGLSRRSADKAIEAGSVAVNGQPASLGQQVSEKDEVTYKGQPVSIGKTVTIMLNKPVGYVCSRDGQGSQTVYDLLPAEFQSLKPVGRLDKDSSGLLLLTNDGKLANELTHPSFAKEKVYEVELNKNLSETDQKAIQQGVELEDGISKLKLTGADKQWTVRMSEGRNRQIRRTFEKLGYRVDKLHRTNFGDYSLSGVSSGNFTQATIVSIKS